MGDPFGESRDLARPGTGDTFRVRACSPAGATCCFVLVHGGGHTGLSWALVAARLAAAGRAVVAPDLRGHGETRCGDERDLSSARLVDDVVWLALEAAPAGCSLVLAGHSLGGSVAVRAAADPRLAGRVAGVCVVDVVEGSALAALDGMARVLARVPPRFPSVDAAVRWAVASGDVGNRESAELSVPARLVPEPGGGGGVRWRTDLLATREHWRGWFEGLSDDFLALRARRLLLLASPDRLDTKLSIAQMQGAYQIGILPAVGHCVQEDAPGAVADLLLRFAARYDM